MAKKKEVFVSELRDKVRKAKFNTQQQEAVVYLISHAHMRGVRYGVDPVNCKENLSYVIRELGIMDFIH